MARLTAHEKWQQEQVRIYDERTAAAQKAAAAEAKRQADAAKWARSQRGK